jgi:hypothetical protein
LVLKFVENRPIGALPRAAFVNLPDLGLEYLPVRVIPDTATGEIRCEFLKLKLPQQRRLIEFLFCQPSQWDRQHQPQSEPRVMLHYYLAGVRMYSLAESR